YTNRTKKFAEALAVRRQREEAVAVASGVGSRRLWNFAGRRRQCPEFCGHGLEIRVMVERRHQERLHHIEPIILRTELRGRKAGIAVGARKQRKRKVPANATEQRHEGADYAPAANVGAEPKPPDRGGEKRRLPLVAKRGARGRNPALQPRLPHV